MNLDILSSAATVPSLTRPASFWPETDWDMVLALRDPAAHEEALADICRKYHPVFLKTLRCSGWVDPEDLAQGFILHLIEKSCLLRVDPARGRFRQYVGRMLMNFARTRYRSETSAKRGGGVAYRVLTDESITTAPLGEEVFDREWALALQKRALESFLREENSCPELMQFALGEMMRSEAETATGYAELSARSGKPESTLRGDTTRLRQRFRERLRQEVALTTVRSEIDEELRYLLQILLAGARD